ncbi:universal stress protein [Nocardioides sp.]|uniref:universal stress protein n=1 Tax=Nocardioides sp. TaxID=35761 RepID=UPI002629EB2D|nr:universal stress protein [Nocardioides sp.]MCW2735535.1 Nucleotide-binding universal stress protein UspA family [Nocardioides sp.]
MTTTLPVLVPFDGSPDAQRALLWAAAESVRTAAPVRVMVVNEVLPPIWGGVSGMGVVTDGFVLDAAGLLEQAQKTLADAGVGHVIAEQRSGHVVDELLRAAASSSSVVVGSRGHGRVEEALLGSVSQHLARHATCPVVVVREARDVRARRIVVGIDGSQSSMAALEYACRRAEVTRETVVAIHGWHVRAPSTDVWSTKPRSVDTEEHELLLAESIAGVQEDHPDVRLEHEVVAVAPAQCLVDASAGASLVVVGSRGLGFFSGMLLGSVSQAVLHGASCPVAVVR